MRLMIAVPCMDMVHTMFFRSFVNLDLPAGTEIAISTSSLIYDARNQLAQRAVQEGFDRMLWLDSDMTFESDLVQRFMADLDAGLEYVSGLAFSRRAPIRPCVYRECGMDVVDGRQTPKAVNFEDIPTEQLFPVAASGLAATAMTTKLISRVGNTYGMPFSPMMGFGEDLSFCMRETKLGTRLWCDSRIKLGHVGQAIFDINAWTASREVR